MNQRSNEKFIIFVSTLASVGLIIENYLMNWEFWIPPVIIVGTIALWAVNLSDRIDYDIRENGYFTYAALVLFYHSIHKTSCFDAGMAVILVMATFSILNKVYMMNVLLTEYFVILFIHINNLPGGDPIVYDRSNVTRLLLHVCIVLLVYYISVRNLTDRLESEEEKRLKEQVVEENEENMEDFLSDISHELRTPVNVVNGMSDLLLKKGAGPEAGSIRAAGARLACQIEDIQDYTECKRNNVFLDSENYMTTSLINDVVTSFRMNDSTGDLEMAVDIDPLTPAMLKGDIKKLHKIFRHLLENAVKFTRRGGILVKLYAISAPYGVNLVIEVTDTGIGMDQNAIHSFSEGMHQANKKRNRSSGGIGLGLFIVHGFAHRMGGFVKVESEENAGTTVRVTIPQEVVDARPCLALKSSFDGAVLFHVRPGKYRVPKLREFIRNMAANLAAGIHVPLYAAETVYEVERLREKLKATHIFMGQEEYEENRDYFEELANEDIVVAVSADNRLRLPENSKVMVMPKPLYANPIINILNDGRDAKDLDSHGDLVRPVFKGVHALIVDDEPMNLVVAECLFQDYEMTVDTADSGKEAIRKFGEDQYDIIFMDHMMPEMDGVEAMKTIKDIAAGRGEEISIIALTANAVSGAREMFIEEGFDGFIAKPINTADFERVMQKVLSGKGSAGGGK